MTNGDQRLKPYAEPVSASSLTVGEVYFMVHYCDKEMLAPVMKSLVFLGRNTAGVGDNYLYFQDLESSMALGTFPDNLEGSGDLYRCTDDQLTNIFELEKAIDELLRCNGRRKGA